MDDSLIPITSVGSSSSSQPAVGSVVRGLIELVELLGLGGASALAGRTGVVSAGDILLGQGAMVDSVSRGGRSTHSSRHVWGAWTMEDVVDGHGRGEREERWRMNESLRRWGCLTNRAAHTAASDVTAIASIRRSNASRERPNWNAGNGIHMIGVYF